MEYFECITYKLVLNECPREVTKVVLCRLRTTGNPRIEKQLEEKNNLCLLKEIFHQRRLYIDLFYLIHIYVWSNLRLAPNIIVTNNLMLYNSN